MTTLHLRKSSGRSPLRLGLPRVQPIWIIRGFLLIALLLPCFALLPAARAVSPPPDGGYPNGNTAEGDNALFNFISGSGNTAIGFDALFNLISGNSNTAIGSLALSSNTASNNTAIGLEALYHNTTGTQNTANGVVALFSNTSASSNTASGYYALFGNTTGNYNTAEGFRALFSNTTGSSNIGLGVNAGYNLTTGSGNVCIGVNVFGVAGENNTTRIKNVYSSVASGRAVYVNSDNKIGTLVSSRRFKDEIKPMDKASETILALQPVTFRYKKEIEPNRAIMFGLIAEEVEKVAPDLVTRDAKGEVEAVRYDAVNAMLLNEFLKEHRTVQELRSIATTQEVTIAQLKSSGSKQEATIAQLKARVAQQQQGMEVFAATLKEQASQIQKVSAALEVSRPAPQTVANDR